MKNASVFSIKPMTFAILLAFSAGAYAQIASGTLPVGPTVVNGTVAINNPAANTMQITNTPGAIVNWNSFSIGSASVVTINQTAGPASSILNRVTGADPSQIMGRLESNGRVFLINPNGVLFGAGSVIDTQSLIASTRDISNANFLAGNYLFEGAGPGRITVDQGALITTASHGPNGQVWLFADKVALQQGSNINAPDGQVMLAAGTQLQVGSNSLGNMTFTVATGSANTIDSYGSVAAQRGAVGMFADSIVHGGQVATGGGPGEVLLMAARDITVPDGGAINASGEMGDSGGHITLNAGNRLKIGAQASVAADGSSQGGSGGLIDLIAYDLQVSPVASGMGNVHASAKVAGAPNGDVRVMLRSAPVDAMPAAGQFAVTLSSGKDMYPTVTTLADGSSVVTWMSMDLPPNVLWDVKYSTVYAQRIGPNGQSLGGRIQIGSVTGNQSYPSVAPTRDGGFLIAWSDGRTGRREVWTRAFDANGMPVTADLKLSSDAGDQDNIKLATLADGRILTTWSSRSSISPLVIDIRAQLVDARGNPVGAPFTINMTGSADKGSQYRPDIAPLADGGFVVTYHAIASGSYYADAYGRRFDRNGVPVGPEFTIAATTRDDWRITTKGLLDGGFVVVWDTTIDSSYTTRMFYRRYDARGVMIQGDTPVGMAPGGSGQSFAQVTPMADGGFVIVWKSYQNGTGSSNADVYAQRFGANGLPAAAPKLVAGGVAGQWEPTVAATADNGYTVTWYTDQNGNMDIYAQRFASPVMQAAVAGGVSGELRNRGYMTAQGVSNGTASEPVLVLPAPEPVVTTAVAAPVAPAPVSTETSTASAISSASGTTTSPTSTTSVTSIVSTTTTAALPGTTSSTVANDKDERKEKTPEAADAPKITVKPQPPVKQEPALAGKTESALNAVRQVTPTGMTDFVLPGASPVFANTVSVQPVRNAEGNVIGYAVSKEDNRDARDGK
ncbi:filamentous hemagglutinin N-terminal domain-containing protein [Noviherbaspirillum sp. UKPF54]|uniref:two-partner secretion domain-containing protein n=1 Tax=Noviherbaspirillum sp. UKPF54 TaxID=2601898 RepID=UPI0011B148F5|nr:filamentous hemagglutinin N-terminal domain-containing protein [Noviherbaspirillum sp. UKPF54]QDZ29914.1 filamentous hemagglutinin N-terminal domain-containing protein [Noviherbaspirillum sp. UKPF54]